jgi:hypothetical protein
LRPVAGGEQQGSVGVAVVQPACRGAVKCRVVHGHDAVGVAGACDDDDGVGGSLRKTVAGGAELQLRRQRPAQPAAGRSLSGSSATRATPAPGIAAACCFLPSSHRTA